VGSDGEAIANGEETKLKELRGIFDAGDVMGTPSEHDTHVGGSTRVGVVWGGGLFTGIATSTE